MKSRILTISVISFWLLIGVFSYHAFIHSIDFTALETHKPDIEEQKLLDETIRNADEILSTRNHGYPTWDHPISDQERADIARWMYQRREEMVKTRH